MATRAIDFSSIGGTRVSGPIDFSSIGGVRINATPIDLSSQAPPPEQGRFSKFLGAAWQSLPTNEIVQAGQHLSDWAKGKAERNRQENLAAAAKGQPAPHSEITNTGLDTLGTYGKYESGSAKPQSIAIAGAGMVVPEVVGPAFVAHGGYTALKNAPEAVQGKPEAVEASLGGLAEATGGAVMTRSAPRPISSKIADLSNRASVAFGRQISPEELDLVPPSGQFQPALANTPREVLNYADTKKIDLTPAEASSKPVAKTIQAVGERSLGGADQLASARQAEALRLAQNVRSFADTVDPKGMGLTEEGAGESIQHTTRVARSTAHENATAAYDQAGIDQANLAGDLSPLKSMVQDETMVRQPGAAVARPEYKQPEVQAALNDIASKPDELGNRPSIQSMRNLRTEFLERSRTDPGEAQTSAQRLYGQAADTVDSQIMKAAQGTPFEDSFRDASQKWADLKQKYDQPGTVLNRILSQRDPATITRSILNRGSANDIQILQNENMTPALDALKRQVVQDVANRGFRVNGDGLGGYSDSFLKSLFGESAAKELYLNGELARRMGFQLNPSGTSNVLLGMEQLSPNPTRWAIPMGAAKASMPRPASSYLSKPGTINLSDLIRAGGAAGEGQ